MSSPAPTVSRASRFSRLCSYFEIAGWSLSEHVAILDAVIASDGGKAETLSRDHISRAAKIFVQRLKAQQEASEEESRQRRTRRIR
jgi:DNA-binding GntR family transcriptional regulator